MVWVGNPAISLSGFLTWGAPVSLQVPGGGDATTLPVSSGKTGSWRADLMSGCMTRLLKFS